MTCLDRLDLDAVGRALTREGLDGWLLYDFRGINPIARRLLGVEGMATRRLFVAIPSAGPPAAIAHRIELQGLKGFPGEILPYAGWQELHTRLRDVVAAKRLAMETSMHDAVPYLDCVPAGVIGLIESLGGSVVTSAPLVTEFAAKWSPEELREHRAAAETIADLARRTVGRVLAQPGAVREAAVQRDLLTAFDAAGLVTTHPPIVAFGANAANPHYEPREGSDAGLEPDQVVLIDLWAGPRKRSVYADQTWMGFAGGNPSDEVIAVWEAIRDAREAVVERLRVTASSGATVTGAQLDDEARGVITDRGFGDAFIHRTGHSIDLDLHGSGPHLDNFETHDTRELLPGVGFSIEPGVYLTGRFGMRTEINAMFERDAPVITPVAPQQDLILPT